MLLLVPTGGKLDRYASFEALRKKERVGLDYRIRLRDRSAPVTVLAIHGGGIETGTSELAEEIAGFEHNFYAFEGLKKKRNEKLHVTSTRFNEPAVLELLARSRVAISVHGYRDDHHRQICVGGSNLDLRALVVLSLSRALPKAIEIREDCPSFPGIEPRNVVNRPRENGVQLEISQRLRNEILQDRQLKSAIAEAIRTACKFYTSR